MADFDINRFREGVAALRSKMGFVPAPAAIEDILGALDLDYAGMAAAMEAMQALVRRGGETVPSGPAALAAALARVPASGVEAYRFLVGSSVEELVLYGTSYPPDALTTLSNIWGSVPKLVFPDASEVGYISSAFGMSLSYPAATSMPYGTENAYGLALDIPLVAAIPANAFANAIELYLNAPSAASVGSEAFCYAVGITRLRLPAAVSIGARAFGEAQIEEVDLPLATDIASDAFSSFGWGDPSAPGTVRLGSRTVAQVQAAGFYGAGAGVVFVCSDGTVAAEEAGPSQYE